MKERASPRRDVYFVPRKHSAEPRGEGALHGLFTVCKRAIGAIYYGSLLKYVFLQNNKFRSRKRTPQLFIIQYSIFISFYPLRGHLERSNTPYCEVETRSANGKSVWISRRQELRRVLASPLEKLRARAIVRGDEESRQ